MGESVFRACNAEFNTANDHRVAVEMATKFYARAGCQSFALARSRPAPPGAPGPRSYGTSRPNPGRRRRGLTRTGVDSAYGELPVGQRG